MHLSGPRRLSLFLSALWAAAFFALAGIDGEFKWLGFVVLGLFPPALLWGCWWVWRGFARR